ncbi:mismatch repair protein [Granulicella sp. S190]|uniref:MutS-related protein n=1 Tax=Granulicella sp. S190 TaxID=1747226 RepID=UPI0020B111B2|nr:mismatch repair protein [Granulicella sp. S190]
MPPSDLSPSEEYGQRLQARKRQVAHFENLHLRCGNLRLLTVVATLLAAWFSLHNDAFSLWWLFIGLAAFLAIAVIHAKVLRHRACAARAVDFYRKGLARIEDRWAGTGQTDTRSNLPDHQASLYATDLDLFGPGSLFELLSQARTRIGEDTLAHWLLSPSPLAEIKERHVAVSELRPCLDLREDIAVLGEAREGADDLKVGLHPEALTQWAEAPNRLKHHFLRWLALALSLLSIASVILWAERGEKIPFFLLLAAASILTASLHKQTAEVLHSTGHALKDLRLLASLLSRLEREHFESPRLHSLRQQLSSHHLPASQAIARLRTIGDYIDALDSPILRALNVSLLYSVQVAYAAESWRSAHGTAVRSWLAATGEAEALLSLSAYSYEHPADPFPEFIEGPPCLIAEQLGHPLIPSAKCVRNSVSLCGETRVLLISGSNMSGKSTLMRAVGINTVLAMAGAPVRAQRMQLTPLQIGASILINDSLQEGSSRFYAEITRLHHICTLAEKNPPVLFLLDELLQGTNSKDRLIGAEGVVNALLESGAIGLISTHDLALTNIGEQRDPRLHNVHLQDEIVDGKMKFDFKLQDGVVTKSNGIELMRLIGLKV